MYILLVIIVRAVIVEPYKPHRTVVVLEFAYNAVCRSCFRYYIASVEIVLMQSIPYLLARAYSVIVVGVYILLIVIRIRYFGQSVYLRPTESVLYFRAIASVFEPLLGIAVTVIGQLSASVIR